MDDVRTEIRDLVQGLRVEIRGMREDLAELKRAVSQAYGQASTTRPATAADCTRSPFQHHYQKTDGSCACQHEPWAR